MNLALFEKIRAIPVFRPLLVYVSGWLLSYLYPEVSALTGIKTLHFFLILLLGCFLFRKHINFWSQTVLLASAFFFLGLYSAIKDEVFISPSETEMLYLAEVADPPVEKEKTSLIKLKLLFCYSDSTVFNNTVYINAYFEKSDTAALFLEIGDRCVVNMKLLELKNHGNPYEFDYAGWLKRKNIFFTAFVKTGHWYHSGSKNDNFLYRCKSFREWLKIKILDYRKDEFIEEKSVLLAITLGTKELLDPGLKSDFADAGAIHVMAVSGLHVGLIWMFIGFLTNFLRSSFIGRMLQFIMIFTILWSYAGITGLSPSVTRSCLMFSLVSFGSLIMRDSSVYNTVLLSAFLQLLFKPDLILDTGFQFSYTAVLSILFFQPLFKKFLYSESVIINWFFDLISVSVAAQILTFPLAIYYFHQFPLYFILSNIIVIPLVTLLMMVFIFSVCFLFLPYIFNISLFILIFIARIMTNSVDFIAGLPYSTAEYLNISGVQMGLLLISALLFLLFIHSRKLLFLKFVLLAFSFFFFLGIYKYSERINNKMLVFNVPNTLAVDILLENKHYLIHNMEEGNVAANLEYYAKSYWIRTYSNQPEFLSIDSLGNFPKEISCQKLPGKSNFILTLGLKNFVFIGDFKAISVYEADEFLTNSEDLLIFDPYFNPAYDKQMIFNPGRMVIAPSCRLYSSSLPSLDDYYLVREQGSLCIDIY
ncbi:MAG: ComEC family competence protein [Bacteroidales bacterium]|nr:ComEC family competence protein [Bacteroidales bacterium]MCF8391630.1 ComEC family competence protein [Bacteroidales bacterium]